LSHFGQEEGEIVPATQVEPRLAFGAKKSERLFGDRDGLGGILPVRHAA
jgi:hypothetical protein